MGVTMILQNIDGFQTFKSVVSYIRNDTGTIPNFLNFSHSINSLIITALKYLTEHLSME